MIKRRVLVTAAIMGAIAARGLDAEASGVGFSGDLRCYLAGLPMAVASAVPSIVNTVAIASGERPSRFWPVSGIVTGAIGGALCLEGVVGETDGENAAWMVAVGAVGVLGVGLGVWALTLPEAGARVAITPVAAVDVRGQLAPGLGVTVTTF